MPADQPFLSAIIPASRPRSLRLALKSIAAARPPEKFECLLVLNGNDEACAAAAAEFSGRIRDLRIIRGAPRSLGAARNAAIREASGAWLCFLDDDVTLPPRYFSALLEKIRLYPDASVIGGPNRTTPESPLFERCVGLVLGSRLCAAGMSRRYAGFRKDAWTDDRGLILCNLCIRREALIAGGLRFDESLVHNEENLLLEEFFLRGRKALHSPELFVFHERRATLAAFCRQCFLSGQGRGAMSVLLPLSLRALHLAPLLLLPGSLGLYFWPAAFLPPAAAYGALAALNAMSLACRHGEGCRAMGWLFILPAAAHLSYAAGLLAGLSEGLSRRLAAELIAAGIQETSPHAG